MRRLKGLHVSIAAALLLNASGMAEETPAVSVQQAEKKEARVARYDQTARTLHAPMYDYYAKKIKELSGITKGVCLDVGSGGGYMGLALAKITDLEFIFLDISQPALEKAKEHIAEDGLKERARTLLANVQDIPLAGASVDLVISRGSIPFWEDPAKGLSEIYRVLKPGGRAFVGGGKGSREVRDLIDARRAEAGMKPFANSDRVHGDGMKRDYAALLESVGISQFKIHQGDDGRWIEMWK